MKSTCKASSDIALVKYWGKKDEKLRLPVNGSISLSLGALSSTTTVEFGDFSDDQVILQGQVVQDREKSRVVKQLDSIRDMADINKKARVSSVNSFPASTGLSSSGSGMAALTMAASDALGLDVSNKELSILARQASGSACRCVCGGVVEWLDGDTSKESYAKTIYPADHLDLVDIVAVVGYEKKRVSSTDGMKHANSSPFFSERLRLIGGKIERLKQNIENKDLESIGELAEAEALEFHSILLTSKPAHIAWSPGTLEVFHAVQLMRKNGIFAYFTINTGFNVHVLTTPDALEAVHAELQGLDVVKETIVSGIGAGPQYLEDHLF